MTSSRRRFLAAVGAAAATVPSFANAATASGGAPNVPLPAASDALVLSGGGARGAYQAGLICALAERSGLADGQPLHPYGLVCCSSIGAINAWFVSTGQYSALRRAWGSIASANIVASKRKYAAIEKPRSFVATRLYEYLHFSLAISRHEQALAQSAPILAWMAANMDPAIPVLTPMVWAVTNMTTQSAEYFYRLPADLQGQMPTNIEQALHVTLGANIIVRPASDDLLHRAILASAAIPIVFDPVVLPMTDGTDGIYIDGSIVSNAAVSIARTFASNVDVVLVDSRSGRSTYPNAIAVALGAYATMQRDIVETAMRDIYFQTLEERARAGPYGDLPSVSIRYVRPAEALSPEVGAFGNQSAIDAMFARGEHDAAVGFAPYIWQTFHL